MRSIFTVASKVRNGIFTALAGTLALGGLAQAQAAVHRRTTNRRSCRHRGAEVVCSGYLYFHHRLHRGNDGRLWYPQSVRLQNLIPATVILPYDAAIRGVGKTLEAWAATRASLLI